MCFLSPYPRFIPTFQTTLFLLNFFCPCCFFFNYFKNFSLLQLSLILSPPLAPPLQLSVQRVCLQAQTTAPLSSL